jgi:hypothetical protein
MKKQILIICSIIFVLASTSAWSQLALHPTAAFIDPNTRTGSMEVVNTSNQMREIGIDFKFGYVAYDENGNQYTEYLDSAKMGTAGYKFEEMEKQHSLAPYIKVFPSKLLVPPQQAATVRFMVTSLPPGEDKFFWTRIVVSSVPQVEQIDSVGENQVAAQLVITSEMIGLVGMLRGKNNADLSFNLVDNYTDTVNTVLLMKQDKKGNSPFWGIMKMEIFDQDDNLVANTTEGLALYTSCKQGVKFPLDKMEQGKKYKAKVEIRNHREAIPEEFSPEAKTESKEFEFVVK